MEKKGLPNNAKHTAYPDVFHSFTFHTTTRKWFEKSIGTNKLKWNWIQSKEKEKSSFYSSFELIWVQCGMQNNQVQLEQFNWNSCSVHLKPFFPHFSLSLILCAALCNQSCSVRNSNWIFSLPTNNKKVTKQTQRKLKNSIVEQMLANALC